MQHDVFICHASEDKDQLGRGRSTSGTTSSPSRSETASARRSIVGLQARGSVSSSSALPCEILDPLGTERSGGADDAGASRLGAASLAQMRSNFAGAGLNARGVAVRSLEGRVSGGEGRSATGARPRQSLPTPASG